MWRADQILEFARVSSKPEIRHRDIIGCAVLSSLGILLFDTLVIASNQYYIGDSFQPLRSVAMHDVMDYLRTHTFFRPLEYMVLTAANNIYLPLWLGASLLCVVGATILSGLACEKLFQRQLPTAGWWVLGLANPLLCYLLIAPGAVSQCLCNLLFAGALLALVNEVISASEQSSSGWRDDARAAFLNLMAAALFFTKETAVAAAVFLPAAVALIRVKTGRFSWIFLSSLLFPIAAAITWMLIRLQVPLSGYLDARERYSLKSSPITWAENFVATLAFPLTPLPTSFMGFALLRPLWIVFALGSVTLFAWLLSRLALRQPKIVLPLLVIAASCAPMVLIHANELYSNMIASFVVATVLLFGVQKFPRLSLAYGLMLYSASLGNGIVYCFGPDLNLFGMDRLEYSLYGNYTLHLPCRMATTAHIAWDGAGFICMP
jgi:hypothetical protein